MPRQTETLEYWRDRAMFFHREVRRQDEVLAAIREALCSRAEPQVVVEELRRFMPSQAPAIPHPNPRTRVRPVPPLPPAPEILDPDSMMYPYPLAEA